MKFAIDSKYTDALERERAEREFLARRQAKFNAEAANYYYACGWIEPDIATVTAMARPTLTTSHHPTTRHKTTK